MIFIIIAITALYYFVFLCYYKKLIPAKKNAKIVTFIMLLFILFIYLLYYTAEIRWPVVPFVLIFIMIVFKFNTGMNWLQSLYGSITCTVNAYSFRGVITTIICMVQESNEILFLHSGNTYYGISVLGFPASLLFLHIIRKTILPDRKLKNFLNNQKQLKMIVSYELFSMILLLIISEGRFLFPHIAWFNSVFLLACLLSIGILIYCIYLSILVNDYSEYKWHCKMMEKQYALQLRHYKSYEQYTESLRSFRHDYKFMLSTLRTLISKGEYKEALHFLDGMYNDTQEKLKVHKKYSNNVILDAMLHDLANVCEENHISYSFKALVPKKTALSMIDAVRIFSNLSTNAVEACLNTSESKRFIHITCENKEGWSTLQIVNSFDGTLTFHHGLPATTKNENINHGIGLMTVKEIVESAGGFMVLDADQKERVFLARVHVPQALSDLSS